MTHPLSHSMTDIFFVIPYFQDWDKDDSEDDSNDENELGNGNNEDGISDMKEGGLRMTSSADMEQLQNKKQLANRKKK